MNIHTENDTLHIAFTSDLLSTNVHHLRPQLMQAIAEAPEAKAVQADLAKCRIVDSMGFNLLIALYRECEKRGLKFRATNPSPEVLRLIKFLNLTDRFGLSEN